MLINLININQILYFCVNIFVYSNAINSVIIGFVDFSLGGLEDVLHGTFPGGSTKISIFSPFVVDFAQFVVASFGSCMSWTLVGLTTFR